MRLFNTLIVVLLLGLASCSNEGNSKPVESNTTKAQVKGATLNIPDGVYSLTKDNSVIVWTAKKLNGSGHEGTISTSNGKIKIEGGVLTSGMLTIDMNSFTCTDLEGEDKEKIDAHLKSDEFLDVDKFPVADVKIIGVKERGDELISSIQLYLHGGTVEYEAPITTKELKLEGGATAYEISGEFFIDRTKHKIIYGSGSFFDNLGDRAINDDVHLKFTFTAV